MEKNKKIVLMSILIALIALLIIILIISFIIFSQKAKKASVENIINPFAINASSNGGSSVNIYSGNADDNDDNDDEDEIDGNPYISNIPDVTMPEDSVFSSLDLDNYARDDNHSLSELVWNATGNINIHVSINNTTHIVTFTPIANWNGAENITFQVTDSDGLYDTDTMTITVTPVDDTSVWNNLTNRNVDEDSADGTVVYANITSQVTDPDSAVNITVASTHTHFQLSVSGNDLVISNLEANWYGSENVVLSANGVTASFTLTVNHLMDDCVKICSWGSCYKYCD